MKTGRAILSGVLIWFLVFSLFGVLSIIPATRDSVILQGIIAGVAIIPSALLSAHIYYQTGSKVNGLLAGIVMVVTALLLDALITVPLVEKPYHGTDHIQFFTNPILGVIVAEVLLVTWLYYKVKVAGR